MDTSCIRFYILIIQTVFQYSLKSILDILQEDKMMLMTNHQMGEYLCVGDQIALYSVETEGYAYSVQSR